MADKEPTERRVYVLPSEQLERIRAYQNSSGIGSEVEAVRRLLDSALQMRDTPQDILKKLKSRYADEKDLRVLARDILAAHALVESVHFADDGVWFRLKGDVRGKIGADGSTYIGDGFEQDGWDAFPPPPPRAPARTPSGARSGSAPSWDAPRGGDLDDEIPF
jgi:hypothetical protein